MIPGVTLNTNTSAEYSVRGGTPAENLVLLDGMRLYRPFHLRDWGIQNLTSVAMLNMDLMEDVTFSSGGFSAQYGDRLASVLDIQTQSHPPDSMTGTWGINFFNATATVSIPLPGGFGAISYRRGYFDLFMNRLGLPGELSPSYYDLFGLLNLSKGRWTLHVTTLKGGDNLIVDLKREGKSDLYNSLYEPQKIYHISWLIRNNSQQNYYQHVKIKYASSKRTVFHFDFSYATEHLDSFRQKNNTETYIYPLVYTSQTLETQDRDQNLEMFEADTKLFVEIHPLYHLLLGCGIEAINYHHNFRDKREINYYPNSDPDSLEQTIYLNDLQQISKNGLNAHLFLENQVYLLGVNVNLGLRSDYFTLSEGFCLSPRLQLSRPITANSTLACSFGQYFQFQEMERFQYSQDKISELKNYVELGRLQSGIQPKASKASHFGLTFSHEPTTSLSYRVEGYYRNLSHLPAQENVTLSADQYIAIGKVGVPGYAKGLECMIRFATDSYSGSYSMAYSKSEEEYPRYNLYRAYDQRVTISAILEKRLSKKTMLKVKWYYGSGYPVLVPLSFAATEAVITDEEVAQYRQDRYPSFHQLDLRLTRDVRLWGNRCQYYVELVNVYNQKNVIFYDWQGGDYQSLPQWKSYYGIPITPFAGMQVYF